MELYFILNQERSFSYLLISLFFSRAGHTKNFFFFFFCARATKFVELIKLFTDISPILIKRFCLIRKNKSIGYQNQQGSRARWNGEGGERWVPVDKVAYSPMVVCVVE